MKLYRWMTLSFLFMNLNIYPAAHITEQQVSSTAATNTDSKNKIDENINVQLVEACLNTDSETVNKLIQVGADVNFSKYEAPLATAIRKSDDNGLTELLLSAKANPNGKDSSGIPYLVYSLKTEKSPFKLVNLLLDTKNCDLNISDTEGNTPLITAAEYHIVDTMYGETTDAFGGKHDMANIINKLIALGANPFATNKLGKRAKDVVVKYDSKINLIAFNILKKAEDDWLIKLLITDRSEKMHNSLKLLMPISILEIIDSYLPAQSEEILKEENYKKHIEKLEKQLVKSTNKNDKDSAQAKKGKCVVS